MVIRAEATLARDIEIYILDHNILIPPERSALYRPKLYNTSADDEHECSVIRVYFSLTGRWSCRRVNNMRIESTLT